MQIVNNKIQYLFIFMSILLQSFSFVCSKFAAEQLQDMSFMHYLFNKYYILSLFFLAGQAYFWQKTLTYMKLSKAYPYTGAIYIFILIYTYTIFNESISLNNIIGTILIIFGIYVINYKKGNN